MARKRQADMTLAQKNAADLNKFRNEIRAEHLEDVRAAPVNDDYRKFRADAYKEALRDAKAQQKNT